MTVPVMGVSGAALQRSCRLSSWHSTLEGTRDFERLPELARNEELRHAMAAEASQGGGEPGSSEGGQTRTSWEPNRFG
jgi:hypothetical protein